MPLGKLRACALLATTVLCTTAADVPVQAQSKPAAPPLTADACEAGPGWTLATDDPGGDYSRHPFVGNGYLSQRIPPAGTGYVATGEKTGFPLNTPRYDGAFLAGLYGTARTHQGDSPPRDRHAIAALPTWAVLKVGVGGATYGPDTPHQQITHYRQEVNLHCGLVRTSLTWTTPDGRSTDLVYDVVADRANPHVGAMRLRITPHWSGRANVTDALNGAGARRLHPVHSSADGPTSRVDFAAKGTDVAGSLASTTRFGPGAVVTGNHADGLSTSRSASIGVHAGRTYQVSKFVGADTALTAQHPAAAAAGASTRAAAGGWDALFARHRAAWRRLWSSDIRTPGRPQMQAWLRSSRYATYSSVRRGSDTSIPTAGLSSDNYAGLVFWDTELWMFPSLLAQHPELAKSIVAYREKTLPAARANAREIGQRGAFYPWTSADTGRLESDCHSWDPPHCLTQNHLQSDIALAAWQYYESTGDRNWLRQHGWPVLQGIAEYWAGRVTHNPDGSYSINNVAGPDEYSNGVNDGAFTNAGAAVTLRDAVQAAHLLGKPVPPQWTAIADHLRIPFDQKHGVFRQYAGYDGHKIKQADTVLLQYPLEWPMSPDVAKRTLNYYAQRTDPDGPAMTDSAHAIDAAANGAPGCATNTYLDRSVRPFMKPPFAQFSEARGEQAGKGAGAPALNFLTGSGGFTQVFTHGLTGLRLRPDRLKLDPMLPPQFPGGVHLTGLHWQGRTYDIDIGPENTRVTLRDGAPMPVQAGDGQHLVSSSAPLQLKTRRPDRTPTDNLARCTTATASSEQPGRYAEAAVDGSDATAWVPSDARASLTTDLGAVRPVRRIDARFTDVAPQRFRLLVSTDGRRFTEWHPGMPTTARYVRVQMSGPDKPPHAGLAELRVK